MDSMSKRLRKVRFMKIRYILAVVTGHHRVRWLKKHDIFGFLGDKVLFQPLWLPNNPKLIKIHNNVKIASDVTFYEHDVINYVFQNIKPGNWRGHHTCIEIFDNCFIGGGSILVGNLRIGPNAIVAAGSVVVKDVPPGTIVGGNPAKVIGSFDKLLEKRIAEDYGKQHQSCEEDTKETWERFNASH